MSQYVSEDLTPITDTKYKELVEREEYGEYEAYDNGRFSVRARWHGFVKDTKNIPMEFWQPFELSVKNIIATKDKDGQPILKSVYDPSASEKFESKELAIQAYREFLIKYAGCGWLDEDDDEIYEQQDEFDSREWVEPGNKLTAQKKEAEVEKLNLPKASDASIASSAGSWG